MNKLNIPAVFTSKKINIISSLNRPSAEYTDLSPKGSIDEGIRHLITQINNMPGYVTTSSCAGRMSVFVQGRQTVTSTDGHMENNSRFFDTDNEKVRRVDGGIGGKRNGGRWLFVSHDPVSIPGLSDDDSMEDQVEPQEIIASTANTISPNGGADKNSCIAILGLQVPQQATSSAISASEKEKKNVVKHVPINIPKLFGRPESPLIHFKFEPMILHILTASLVHANLLLRAAIQAGFRESGALNLVNKPRKQGDDNIQSATPVVGIRSTGLALESIVGVEVNGIDICVVPEWQARGLMMKANQRFEENARRIENFQKLLFKIEEDSRNNFNSGSWEDAVQRKIRKRRDGLLEARVKSEVKSEGDIIEDSLDIECLEASW